MDVSSAKDVDLGAEVTFKILLVLWFVVLLIYKRMTHNGDVKSSKIQTVNNIKELISKKARYFVIFYVVPNSQTTNSQ